jgi:hypothetical protein
MGRIEEGATKQPKSSTCLMEINNNKYLSVTVDIGLKGHALTEVLKKLGMVMLYERYKCYSKKIQIFLMMHGA